MFRNLRCYRLASPWPATEAALSEALEATIFRPCAAFAERSAGWEPPGTGAEGPLCRRLHKADLLQLRTQMRVLPAAAIREALEDRVLAFRERLGVEPPRAELRKLKDETRDALLPQAPLKSERTRALYLADESLLVVDAASPAKAEWLLDHLRASLGRLEVEPLQFQKPVGNLMQRVFLGPAPRPFSLGRECRLQDPANSGATGTWKNVDLSDPGIRHHVEAGFRLGQLGMGFDEIISFVLADDGSIGRFRFLEGQVADHGEDTSPVAHLDAEIVLLAGTLRRLLTALRAELGAYVAPATKQLEAA